MLNLRSVEHLAAALRTSVKKLHWVACSKDQYIKKIIVQGRSPGKQDREVICVTGALRGIQDNLHTHLLSPAPSTFNTQPWWHQRAEHKDKRRASLKVVFCFACDIANFYPSIRYTRLTISTPNTRVLPDVARLLTQLCTEHHLALGLITSPILADCILEKVDHRIRGMCIKHDLIYTRFVDDITISGKYDIASGATE
ncbi:MAG: hypothetical protein U0790_21470 [Isosphaeraceae bacterium]